MNFEVFTKFESGYLSSLPDESFNHFLNIDFAKAKD